MPHPGSLWPLAQVSCNLLEINFHARLSSAKRIRWLVCIILPPPSFGHLFEFERNFPSRGVATRRRVKLSRGLQMGPQLIKVSKFTLPKVVRTRFSDIAPWRSSRIKSGAETWNLFRRFCKMFSESSTGRWAVLQLPCCQSKQWKLSENILQNHRSKLQLQTVQERTLCKL